MSSFNVLRLIGDGGAASVFQARLHDYQAFYAIKRTEKRRQGSMEHAVSEREVLRTVSKLRKPFLSNMRWSFEDDSYMYFVLVRQLDSFFRNKRLIEVLRTTAPVEIF